MQLTVERSLLQGEGLARGPVIFGEWACEEASLRIGPRRQSRGIDQGPDGSSRLGNEARRRRVGLPNDGRQSRIVTSRRRFTRRWWKRSWPLRTGREEKAREAPRFESAGVTEIVRGSVVVRCGTSKEKLQTKKGMRTPRAISGRLAEAPVTS